MIHFTFMSTFVLILICNLPNVNCLPTSDDEKIDLLKSLLADEINKELAKLPQNDQSVQVGLRETSILDLLKKVVTKIVCE
uniref:Hypotheticial protein n=1 Tax=Schistosoma japonicum TaxID=6182 RepID=C1LEB8_SCHJA|nr:hypotheticial protein [Schistosoma japonicum]